MSPEESFDYRIRNSAEPGHRNLWKAIAATLICAGAALALLVAAKSASQIFPDPALLMDPPVMQSTDSDREPPQYVKRVPAKKSGT